ncbi:MAG: hypothetical protein F4X08_08815 [Gemmatimonadetes bacterium]|nr:hypothetical protein [Gemmatimonadota bacterium]MYD25898.1 hypothetical protein [Gemmatimonadota bacterium]MYI98213.1 hypothetical protein [Gemmatimonadota bacterium]
MTSITSTFLQRIRSFRAVLIGAALSIFIGFAGEYSANQIGYEPAATHLPPVFLVPFLFCVLLPNALVARIRPASALSFYELIMVFAMGWIASTVPDQAMTKYLLVVITAPFYFASPENSWETIFFPYLPEWLVLSDRAAARVFYEGLQSGQSIPWGAWLSPLFWWGTFILILLFVGACIVVMLRKQWVEHERLQFPLGEVGLHLISLGGSRGESGAKEKGSGTGQGGSRWIQAGAAAMSLVMIWNIVSFWGVWPPVPIMAEHSQVLSLDPAFPGLNFRMNVFVFCLLIFVNRDVLLSMWLFLVFYVLQEGSLNLLGVGSTSGTIIHGGLSGIQSIAGLVTFVLFGLWMARRHLGAVWRHALGRRDELDDAEELFSYRTAVFGFLLGLLFIICWLYAAGLSLPIMALFIILLFIFYIALARVVAETGVVTLDLPINSHQFSIAIVGSAQIGRGDLTALGMANGFARNWRTFTMIGTSHVAWLKSRWRQHRQTPADPLPAARGSASEISSSDISARHLFAGVALAFCLSAVASIGYVIYAGNTFGAQNLRTDLGTDRGIRFYDLIVTWVNNATQISNLEILFFGSGVVMMIVLLAGRFLLPWWPLHPIGMVVVMSAPVRNAFLTIFLAWLVQAIVFRIGGPTLYQKVRKLFIGILLAYLFWQLVAMGVDLAWFPDRPHRWESY